MSGSPSIGFIKMLFLLPVAIYIILALFAFLFGNKLAFPAPQPGYVDSPDIVKFQYTPDGKSVSTVFLNNPGSSHLVFYHHGNAEDLQSILPRLETLRQSGFSVLAWDYPGYGTSEGKPSEKIILEIAESIMHGIPNTYGYQHEQIIQYGRSIGSGPAIFLSQHMPAAGLILEGAFTSIFRVVTRVSILPWDIFDNLSRISNIDCPVLMLHGTSDHTVPFHHGRRLFEKAPQPKFFTWLESGRHNNLVEDFSDTYQSSISRFKDYLNGNMPPT